MCRYPWPITKNQFACPQPLRIWLDFSACSTRSRALSTDCTIPTKTKKNNSTEKLKKRVFKVESRIDTTSPMLYIFSVDSVKYDSLSIPILIKKRENEIVKTLALIDSGAGGTFIDQNYARNTGLTPQKLEKLIIAQNVNGTENKKGKITSFLDIELTINNRSMRTRAHITGLGKQKIILSFPWLTKHNPDINWKTGKFAWRPKRPFKIKRHTTLHKARPTVLSPTTITEETDWEEHLNHTQNPNNDEIILAYIEEVQKPNKVCINVKTSNTIEFHLQHDEKTFPSNNKFQKLTTHILMFLTKKRPIDSLNNEHWTTKSNWKMDFNPNPSKRIISLPKNRKS